jgi:tetratricopeptide (TPR) repeat protein
MQRKRSLVVVVVAFALGVAAGVWASKKGPLGPELWSGKSGKDAGAAVLAAARGMAEKNGSWERIAAGRVMYLSGDKAGGTAIFDSALNDKKAKAGDDFRVAKVYLEAGEWDKARPLFDKVLQLEPKDEDWLAQIGAIYLQKGDRAKAEELFARSVAGDPDNLYNALRIASGYLGVKLDL